MLHKNGVMHVAPYLSPQTKN